MDPRLQPFMEMSKATLNFQLSPSKSAKDAAGVLAGMITATRAAQNDPAVTCTANIRYGTHPRQMFDLYLPRGVQGTLPCLVFIHGGFWQEGDKSVSGFAAKTFVEAGFAYVGLGYTITPEVTLTELVSEIRAALLYLQQHAEPLGIDPNRIVVTGHSAGAHLAACLLCEPHQIAGAMLISGVYDLAPIARSYVSDLTPMTGAEIATLSPLRHAPQTATPIHLLIGADESEAFQIQTDLLLKVWKDKGARLSLTRLAGRDHFDILHALNDTRSDSFQFLLRTARK